MKDNQPGEPSLLIDMGSASGTRTLNDDQADRVILGGDRRNKGRLALLPTETELAEAKAARV